MSLPLCLQLHLVQSCWPIHDHLTYKQTWYFIKMHIILLLSFCRYMPSYILSCSMSFLRHGPLLSSACPAWHRSLTENIMRSVDTQCTTYIHNALFIPFPFVRSMQVSGTIVEKRPCAHWLIFMGSNPSAVAFLQSLEHDFKFINLFSMDFARSFSPGYEIQLLYLLQTNIMYSYTCKDPS